MQNDRLPHFQGPTLALPENFIGAYRRAAYRILHHRQVGLAFFSPAPGRRLNSATPAGSQVADLLAHGPGEVQFLGCMGEVR